MDQGNGVAENGLRYSGFWARLGASVLDVIILFFFISIAEGLTYRSTFPWSSAIVNFIVSLGYYIICLSWKNRTIGQWIFRQVVVLSNGSKLPPDVAIKRSAYIIITYLLLGLPLLTIIFSKKKQAMHDMMADTVVIRK